MNSQNRHKGDLFQAQDQLKESILHGHYVTAERMEKAVIQWQRGEIPACKSTLRQAFPGDEYKLILQKFATAAFHAGIVSIGLQLLSKRS